MTSPAPAPGVDLLTRCARFVGVPSVSRSEGRLADLIELELRAAPWLEVDRVGDNLVARARPGPGPRLVVAGHLDTVPPDSNAEPRRAGGTLWGLGAADMKGGLAVMVDLATTIPRPAPAVTYIFYVAEEIDRRFSGLLELEAARPDLLEAAAAIVCEPTGAVVEAGCQGVLKAEVRLKGTRAHVARPWAGRNAVHRLGPLLACVSGLAPREAEVDGCRYTESLQVVRIWGGGASNVLPDEAGAELNFRFAPDRTVASASQVLADILGPSLSSGDELEVTDSAPAASPSLGQPLLAALVEAADGEVRAKLGWTDVAFFAERGIPAANFGPGDPELAHTRDEHVTAGSLERVRAVLGRLLGEEGR
ncbi:MAG TPA: succinyl-diaminopimelate desuccinylase [Acidimicrobiales bacterium]|nr:succinyl-diaminopimelate desuccinylase [Acidimicrobiales bacterium]